MRGVLRAETADWPDPDAAVVVATADEVVGSCGDVDQPRSWASVTKIVTALAVLGAVERGHVGLDDEVGPPGSTLSHLLDHSSGLSLEGGRVVAAPGTRRVYSNAGYELAAGHLERRGGEDVAGVVVPATLARLGMRGAALTGSPAHGLVASCGDVVRLARELVAPRTLDRHLVAALSRPSRPGLTGVVPGFGRQVPNDWGLGAEVRGRKSPHWTAASASPGTFGHFGQSGTFLWVDPAAGLVCVSASREPFGAWAQDRWPRLSEAVLSGYAPG